MILDALQFFDNPGSPRDLAQVAGTYASTNILDYGLVDSLPAEGAGTQSRDMGIGDKPALKLLVQVGTAFVGGTSLVVNFQGSISDANGDPASWTTWYSTGTILTAALTAGARLWDIDFPRPPNGVAVPRFVRLTYTIVGTMTAGTMIAGIVLDRIDQMYSSTNTGTLGGYPAGINVAN